MIVYVVKYYSPDTGLRAEVYSRPEDAKRVRDEYLKLKLFDMVGLEDIVVDSALNGTICCLD